MIFTLRTRLRGADPLAPLVLFVSLIVYVLHGYDGALTRDLGVYVYGGQRFLAGDPPYVGVLNRAGPLAHLLPGIGIALGRLVGVADVHGARAFFTALSVACVGLMYLLARDVFGSRGAGLVAAAGFLSFQGFLDLATDGPREKTAMVLFLLATLLALRHRRWATAGAFVALDTLTWQPVFIVALVTGLVAVAFMPEGRVAALVRVVIGGATISALMMAYYAVAGALPSFFEGFILINAKYTTQGNASRFSETWAILRVGYGDSVWLMALGLVALPLVAGLAARSAWSTRDAAHAFLLAIGAGELSGLAWSFVAFNGWPDLFELLPFAALGLGGPAVALLARLDRSKVTIVAAVLALALTAFATVTSVTTRGYGLLDQRASVRAVLRTGPAHPTILSVQAPEVLAIAKRRNPSRIQMFTNGFDNYVADTWPGGLDGYGRYVERTAPTYIVVQTGLSMPWLDHVLKRAYVRVAAAPKWVWWIKDTIPAAVRGRINNANRKALGW